MSSSRAAQLNTFDGVPGVAQHGLASAKQGSSVKASTMEAFSSLRTGGAVAYSNIGRVAVAASFTATSDQIRAGLLHLRDGGIGAGFDVTLPSEADMTREMEDMQVNDSFILQVVNESSQVATLLDGADAWTLGMGNVGTDTIADEASRRFLITKTGAATCNIIAIEAAQTMNG
jgi:hypothetical protein